MLLLPCRVPSGANFRSMAPRPTMLAVLVLFFNIATICAAQADVQHGWSKPPILGALSKLDISSKTYAWVSTEHDRTIASRIIWQSISLNGCGVGPTVTVQRPKGQASDRARQLARASPCSGSEHAYRSRCH